jgi:membrane fusion protein (multidrug efflux system)
MEVSTVKIKEETLPLSLEYFGFAESSHPVEIRARVDGYLNKICYVEGDRVKEGEVLFEIDPLPFQAALDIATGELHRQEAILWEASVTVERLKPLFEKKAASQRDLDSAIGLKLAAEAAVESAKASVRTAQLNLDYTTIKSPINGLSTLSNFRQGALIMPGQNGLLTTVSVIDPIWIKFNVSSNDMQKMANEAKQKRIQLPKGLSFEVEVILADGTVFPYQGKVDFTAPTIDPATGTMIIRATINNPSSLGLNQIRPGLFVRAKLLGAIRPAAIAVSQQAVQQGQEGMFVFVVNKDNQAEVRTVEAGDWYKDQWIITSGLTAGDEVIVEGVNKVMNGQHVKIKTAPNSSEPKEK